LPALLSNAWRPTLLGIPQPYVTAVTIDAYTVSLTTDGDNFEPDNLQTEKQERGSTGPDYGSELKENCRPLQVEHLCEASAEGSK
jgi:hypothetical protein